MMWMLRNRGLAFKLIVLILFSMTVIFCLAFGYNYLFSRRIIVKNIEKNAGNLLLAKVNRIDKVLRAVEKVPGNLAHFIETASWFGGSEIIDLLNAVVENNPEIYGAAIAFEPYAYSKNARFFCPYVSKSAGKTEFTYIPYDYFTWDWYQIPKELNHAVWSEPYFDEGAGNVIMSTYSVPFYRSVSGKKTFVGIVTADISLSWLQQVVSSIKIGRTGYGFLLSKNGTFITHPQSLFIMNETIFSVAEAMNNAYLRELGRSMIRGESGFVPVDTELTGKGWLAYAALPSNSWSLGVLFPQGELMADIIQLNRNVLIIAAAGFMFVLLIIILIARSITEPIRALSRATEVIAAGNLDIELPSIRSGDEVGKLSESFEHMRDSLKQYIRDLTESTAAKERIESELKIAHEIQMGILPKSFPPFPERHEFEIFAMLESAKEVGGDLYDFFFVDDDHLCFTIGDVSDKGVPASLFMAITRTLVKTKASQGLTPGIVMNRVNQDLSVDNPSLMFVTLFLGFLHIRTGELEYVNGGHNPPFLIRLDGRIEPLEPTGGMALGVMEDISYRSRKTTLHKGETLFLYTDGVTEAMNRDQELFSEERLIRELTILKDEPTEKLIQGVMTKVRAFCAGVPQTDDITMMRIKYCGF